MPIPRKLARSMKLVALVTYTLLEVTQRIRASSTNSIMKLAKTSLARSLGWGPAGDSGRFCARWSLVSVSVIVSARSALALSESFPVSTVQP
jgi:hypothetical protein